MSNSIQIANNALDLLETDNLTSFDAPSDTGDVVRRHYPQALKAALEHFPYHFAERRVALSKLAGGSDDPFFAYAYAKPADSVAIRRLMPAEFLNDTTSLPFREANEVIYTDLDGAVAHYTTSEPVPGRFTQTFVDYLSAELAVRLWSPLRTASVALRDLSQMRDARLMYAKAHSFNQSTFSPLRDVSDFERSRDDVSADPRRWRYW
ncbi:MAG: hypothetical protein AAFR28_14220 [Pseudomonadota bacterium]